MATPMLHVVRSKTRWLRRSVVGVACALLALVVLSLWHPTLMLSTAAKAALRLVGIQSRYVQLGAYRIHYFVGGTGEPLVLVHGLGGRALDFFPLMPGLAKSHRIFALDLLGYGASDRPDADYSIPLQTEILRLFLESQGLQRTDLAGWSMGGWISLNYAAQSPERLRRLVLLDAAGVKFVPTFDLHLLAPHTTKDMMGLERLLTPHPERVPGFLERDLLRRLREEDWVIERAVASMATGRDVMDGKLQKVTMPVLILWGKQDTLTPLSVGEAMRREIPQSLLAVLDGCGHAAPVECRDRVLPEIQRFLAAQPPLPPSVHEIPAPH